MTDSKYFTTTKKGNLLVKFIFLFLVLVFML